MQGQAKIIYGDRYLTLTYNVVAKLRKKLLCYVDGQKQLLKYVIREEY